MNNLRLLTTFLPLPTRRVFSTTLHHQLCCCQKKGTIISSHSSMDLHSVVAHLERMAPSSLSESWDNVGLLIEPSTPSKITSMLLTNDLTEAVLDEAISNNCDFILSYHPPIFQSMKRFRQNNVKERIAVKCMEERIAVFSPHTSWDAVEDGVNDWLIGAFNPYLDCSSQRPIHPAKDSNVWFALDKQAISTGLLSKIEDWLVSSGEEALNSSSLLYVKAQHVPGISGLAGNCSLNWIPLQPRVKKNTGSGRYGELKDPLRINSAVQLVKDYLDLSNLRLAVGNGKTTDSLVKTVAVCAGSGSSVLSGCPADLYLTGEMSHHDVLAATSEGRSVILCEHSNSERGFLKVIQTRLSELFDDKVKVNISSVDCDPLLIV